MLRPITSFNKDPYKFMRFMLPESCQISYLFDPIINVLNDYKIYFSDFENVDSIDLYSSEINNLNIDDKGKQILNELYYYFTDTEQDARVSATGRCI